MRSFTEPGALRFTSEDGRDPSPGMIRKAPEPGRKRRKPDSMWKNFWNLVLVALLVAGAAFVTAPWFAFRALKADARDVDTQGLAELIDYKAVRADLVPQLKPGVVVQQAPAPDIFSDPIGAMRRALQPLTAGPPPPETDSYLLPDGLYDLTRGYKPGKGPPAQPAPKDILAQAAAATKEPWPTLRYWGPNRSRFAIPARTGTGEVIFTFQRRGWYEWKLVSIRLPEGLR